MLFRDLEVFEFRVYMDSFIVIYLVSLEKNLGVVGSSGFSLNWGWGLHSELLGF